MADLKTHCQDCLKELGEDFRHVHEWLDELFKYAGVEHRDYRHNQKGVGEVRRRWGDKAAKAAEIHLRRDAEGSIIGGGVE
jgi:hypothetical protein